MTHNRKELDAVPDPRWGLMEHLETVARKRVDHKDVAAQHAKLQTFIKAEADAQANVDAIRQRDARELAEQLAKPSGLHVTVDHCELGDAEFEMMRAKREADVARACEATVVGRVAESSEQIAALERRTTLIVTEVVLDECRALAAEINADAKRLRAKYARLWGLRRHIGDTPAIRKRLEDFPLPMHPDHVAPDPGEIMTAADAWRGYAARLAIDADAEFKE